MSIERRLAAPAAGERGRPGPLLLAVRYGLPGAVVVTGVAIFLVDPAVSRFEGAAALVGAGLSVLLLNVLHRVGVRGDGERAEEEAARRYFDAHGRWPEDGAPGEHAPR